MAEAALDDVLNWFKEESGSVGIFDGTNSTRQRREFIIDRVSKANTAQMEVKATFIEVICNDEESL